MFPFFGVVSRHFPFSFFLGDDVILPRFEGCIPKGLKIWCFYDYFFYDRKYITSPDNLLIGYFPLQAHCFEKLLWILKLYLFSPSDDVDESQDGIIEIVDLERVVVEERLFVFGVVDEIDDALEEVDIDEFGGGEEQESSSGDHCCKF